MKKNFFSLLGKGVVLASGLILTSFGITQAQNVNVVSTGGTPSATYATLGAAIAAVNAGTHTNDIRVYVAANTTESAMVSLSASGAGAASYTNLSIRPDAAVASMVTVSLNLAASPVLTVRGSQVAVNGFKDGGSTSLLRFTNTNNTGSVIAFTPNTAAITTDTVANMSIVMNAVAAATGIGINAGSSTQTFATSNIVVTGNTVVGGGISMQGAASATFSTTNLTFSGNTISDFNGTAIFLNGGVTNVGGNITVNDNTIFSSNGFFGAGVSTFMTGIRSNSLNSNTTLNAQRNNIFSLRCNTNSIMRGFSLFLGLNTVGHVWNIYNNHVNLDKPISISTLSNTTAAAVFNSGGGTPLTSSRGVFNIRHNTFRLSGTLASNIPTSGSPTLSLTCVVNILATNTTCNFTNNILSNTRTGGQATGSTSFRRHMVFQFPRSDASDNAFSVSSPGFVSSWNFNTFHRPLDVTPDMFVAVQSGPHVGGFLLTENADYTGIKSTLDGYVGTTFATKNIEGLGLVYPNANSPTWTTPASGLGKLIAPPVAAVPTDFTGNIRGLVSVNRGATEQVNVNAELGVTQLYTLGRIPFPFAFPHVASGIVRNYTAAATSGFETATITISGANSIVKSRTIPVIPAFGDAFISFDTIFASDIINATGTQTLTASVGNDDDNSNNALAVTQDMSVNTYSLGYRIPPATDPVNSGGVGFTGATGDFVAKFLCSQASELNQVKVYFANAGGASYRVLIFADDSGGARPGTLLYTSPLYTSIAGFDTKVIEPAIPVNGNFYIGLRQTNTSNISFAYQSEAPPRPATFYFSSPAGSTDWSDFAVSNSPFKFLIEPRLRAAFDIAALAITEPVESGCFGGITTLKASIQNAGQNPVDFSVTPATVRFNITNPGGSTISNVVINSGTLAKDSVLIVSSSTNMAVNGTYTFAATILWPQDLISDNNVTPTVTRIVSRITSLPLTYSFTPTGSLPINNPLLRTPIVGTLNWIHAGLQASPSLAPVVGTGVLTANIFNAQPNTVARVQLSCLSLPVLNFPVMQLLMSQDPITSSDSLRVLFSTDGGTTYNFHSNYARFNAGGTGWRTVKVNLPNIPDLRIALDAKAGTLAQNLGRDISVHDIQIYDCGTGGLWLAGNNDWFDGNNWCSGTVPTAATDVIVRDYAGVANPVVDGQVANAKNLSVLVGKSLTLTDSSATGLSVNGNLTFGPGSNTFTDQGAGIGTTIDGGVGSTINTAGYLRTFGKLAISNTVTSVVGNKINITDQFKVKSEGIFTNNATLTLLSTATKTANLAEIDGLSIYQGPITVDRYVSPATALPGAFAGAYHQIASPIQSSTLNSMFAGKVDIRYDSLFYAGLWYYANIWNYNALSVNMANNGWENPANGSYAMGPLKSVRMWFNYAYHTPALNGKNSIYTITGTPNIGNYSAFLNFCPSGCTFTGAFPNGFNLVGNPYASAVSWPSVSASSTNVDDAIWAWNAATGNYGSFVANVSQGGQTGIIPSGGAVFVRANAPGAQISFQESDKSTNTTTSLLRSSAYSLFRIKMSSAGMIANDEAVVVFRSTATRGYDRQFDAPKMAGSTLTVATLPIPSTSMSINSMPEMTATSEDLIVQVTARASGTYNLTFNGFENIDPTAQMYLRDYLTNTMTPIIQGTNYSFAISSSNPASSATGRFVITYGLGTPTSIAAGINTKAAMVVYPNPSSVNGELSISVSNLGTQNVKVAILDVLGRVAYTNNFVVNGTETQVNTVSAGLTSGVYTVTLEGKFGRITQKITVQ